MSTTARELETSKKKEQKLQALRKKEAQLIKTTRKREEERRRKESELTTELTELKKKELEHKKALETKKCGLEASLKNTAELRKKEKYVNMSDVFVVCVYGCVHVHICTLVYKHDCSLANIRT